MQAISPGVGPLDSDPVLDFDGRRRIDAVRRGGSADQDVDLAGIHAGLIEGALRGAGAEIRLELPRAGRSVLENRQDATDPTNPVNVWRGTLKAYPESMTV
jgi:hypothetical protein